MLYLQASPRQCWGHTYTEKSFLYYMKFKFYQVFHLATIHDEASPPMAEGPGIYL